MTDTGARKQVAAAGAVILVAGLLAFSNSFGGPFVFDDPSSITLNPTIRHLWDLGAILRGPRTTVTAEGRPLLNLSLAINYAISGKEVWSYHLLNLIIHLAAGLLLFGFLRRILSRTRIAAAALPAAFAIALLWTVHPLQTESVTYVVQRAESMMGLFFFLTLYAFVRKWYVVAAVACLCGMVTKEDMVAAPFVVLLCDFAFYGNPRRRWGAHLALFLTLLALAYCIWSTGGNRGGSVGFDLHLDLLAYWNTQYKAIARYLGLVFWPHPLIFEYGSFWIYRFWVVWPQALLVFSLLGASIYAMARAPQWGLAGFAFFAVLAPTSIVPGTTQMIVEHRMYLPLASVLAVVVVALFALEIGLRRRLGAGPRCWVSGAIVAVGAVAFTVVTYERNNDYRDAVGLWEQDVALRPGNALARTMLAECLERVDRNDEAWSQLDQAVRLRPSFALAQEDLGELLARRGQLQDAIDHYRAAIAHKSDYADAHDNLGSALARLGKRKEAMKEIETALRIKPDYAMAHYNLAGLMVQEKLPQGAIEQYKEAIRLQPDFAAAHYNLANTLGDLNRTDEALAEYAAAVRDQPIYPQAQYNWANTLASAHRPAEAIPHYLAVLRNHPDDEDAIANLGSAYLDAGRLEDAAREFEAALRIAPDDTDSQQNLERVRAALAARKSSGSGS